MQGRLRDEYLTVKIETQCSESHKPIHITLDSDLKVISQTNDAQPLVFLPDVDWANFSEATILDAY